VAADPATLHGIWAAVLTPFDSQLRPDAAKAIAYYRELLDRGCDGVNVLGTTGEAMSFGLAARIAFMEALAAGGLPLERAMVGTGAAGLDDAAALTSAAIGLGFAAALVMPPFFFRDAGDDGILRFYDVLFSRVASPTGRVVLYNFPAMSGIAFRAALVDRLLVEFPGRIVGVKDSSNDRALQHQIVAQHPELVVLPGSEAYLLEALAYGAAGCISGSVALWPELAQSVYRRRSPADARHLADLRASLDGLPFIPAVRYCAARLRGDESWSDPMPPLDSLSKAQRSETDRVVRYSRH
jgi:4-hydroxy-tetrahydrodipicolinate synthase